MRLLSVSVFFLFTTTCIVLAQEKPELTVEKIMRDPKTWIGTSPSNPYWSDDSKTIYFNWNPEVNAGDSLYKFGLSTVKPEKVSKAERITLPSPSNTYSKDRMKRLYIKNGDVYIVDIRMGKTRQLTNTVENEINPAFTQDEQQVTFTFDRNLFAIDLVTGQLTDRKSVV